jgi:hypothetical protein
VIVEEVFARSGMGLLPGSQLVAGHCRDGFAREHRAATAQEHPRERPEVVHRGHESRGTVTEGRRMAPGPTRFVPHDDPFRTGAVRGRESSDFGGPEDGVAHAQCVEDPRPKNVRERLACGSRDQNTEH